MRRWRGLWVAAGMLPAIAQADPDVTASASPSEDPAPAQAIGYGAMPGGINVPDAIALPRGAVEVGLLSGFGYRKGLLAADERFGRAIGDVAIAVGVTPALTLGLSFDGRYDRHYGLPPSGDDGYVGDPHITARFIKPSGNLALGAQLGIWVPGRDAPSIVLKAISIDGRALLSIPAGPGTLSLEAGFRFDNSAKSIDDPTKLSVQDQVSLGVSSFNAVLAGIRFVVPSRTAFFAIEASTDVFVGTRAAVGNLPEQKAPGPILRAGITGGLHLNDQWSALAYLQGAKVPGLSYGDVMANNITLISYEPVITGGLGLEARFGGPKSDHHITANRHATDVTVIEYADLSGQVTDEAGKPIVGAKVTVTLKDNTGTGATDDKGNYTVTRIPIGKTVAGTTTLDDTGAQVVVAVDGKKPGTTTLTLGKGPNTAAKIVLEPVLPPGQLRAIVRSLQTGKAIAGATVTIEPGGGKATSGADGTFSVDLAPGSYKITVHAPAMAEQQLDVTIDPNGVAIKNIEMHR